MVFKTVVEREERCCVETIPAGEGAFAVHPGQPTQVGIDQGFPVLLLTCPKSEELPVELESLKFKRSLFSFRKGKFCKGGQRGKISRVVQGKSFGRPDSPRLVARKITNGPEGQKIIEGWAV